MPEVLLMVTLSFLLLFFISRLIMEMRIKSFIKKSKYIRDRKKGQSFWEWLTYKRFADILPRGDRIPYFANIIVFFIMIILTIILGICNVLKAYTEVIYDIQFIGMGIILFTQASNFGINRWKK